MLHLTLSILAVWRITHLLAKEDGPFDWVYRLRVKMGNGFWGHLLDCFYCLSIWVSLPFGIWLGHDVPEQFLYWIALSGAACLLEQGTTNSKNKPPDIPDYTEE
ncbi:MAG: hypothetical protein J7539_01975 [Niabella sp.]|nr:hypothetical protein [Niabella sp.]